MTTLKEELKELIDSENDINRLESIRNLLTSKQPHRAAKEFITSYSLNQIEEIKPERVLTGSQAFARKDPSKMRG